MQGNKSFTQKQTPYITTISFQYPKSSIRENKHIFGLENNNKNLFQVVFLTSWVKEIKTIKGS